MTAIIRGTTPTFKKTFDIVDPTDITVAILTVRGGRNSRGASDYIYAPTLVIIET